MLLTIEFEIVEATMGRKTTGRRSRITLRRLLLIMTFMGLTPPMARADTIDAVLDSLQYTAFRYFWDQANPTNGLIRDRSQSGSPCSIASEGFGLSATCIAIDHGWVSRTDGANR